MSFDVNAWMAYLKSLSPWSREYQAELLRLWQELVSDMREQLARQETERRRGA